MSRERSAVDIDVLFEGGGIIVIDKPAGLDMDELRHAMRESFEIEPGFDGPSFLGRLDRPTSGIVIAALEREALRAILPSWESGAIEKHYLVVVHGKLRSEGRIDFPLVDLRKRSGRAPRTTSRAPPTDRDDAPDANTPQSRANRTQPALTTFALLAYRRDLDISLVDARIHTGRTHQIRRHMKAIGHPVVGDARYGHRARDVDLTKRASTSTAGNVGDQLLLHSWRAIHDGATPFLPRWVEAPIPEKMRTAFPDFS